LADNGRSLSRESDRSRDKNKINIFEEEDGDDIHNRNGGLKSEALLRLSAPSISEDRSIAIINEEFSDVSSDMAGCKTERAGRGNGLRGLMAHTRRGNTADGTGKTGKQNPIAYLCAHSKE
jgi:hypothetical protein